MAVVLIPVACGGERQAEAPVPGEGSVTDPTAVWTLASEPDYSVSESADDPVYQLFGALYALLLADGTAVVANRGAQNLVFLDSTGLALAVVGRAGPGPGEFTDITSLFHAGDEVGVWDQPNRRVSFFSSGGSYQRSLTLPLRPLHRVAGVIPGEGLVTSLFDPPENEARAYQVWDDPGVSRGEFTGALEPPATVVRYVGFPPGSSAGVTSSLGLPLACGTGVADGVVGDQVFAADLRGGVVTATASTGQTREVHRSRERRTITEEMLDALRASFERRPVPAPPDSIESMMRRIGSVGEPLSAWRDMTIDPSGRLWLRRESCLESSGPALYDVIDLAGTLVATIAIPEDLSLRAVHGDRVLVRGRGPLDVEAIERYRVAPAPP